MDSGDLVSLRDLLKVKVFDVEDHHVGHVQDLAMERNLADPRVAYLGAHVLWTDRVGKCQLARKVEDIVLLFPWSVVTEAGEEGFRLGYAHPQFPAETAAGKWLIRRDILDKQMVDRKGNRIQRVDDVLMRQEGRSLAVAGLAVSTGLAGHTLRRFLDVLRKKYAVKQEIDMIPWDAVHGIDDEEIVIAEDYLPEH